MSFYFQITFHVNEEALRKTDLQTAIPNAQHIIVTSTEYFEYESCLNDLIKFLKFKAKSLSSPRKKYNVIFEKNPFILNEEDLDGEDEIENDRWFKNEVLKMKIIRGSKIKKIIDLEEEPISASMFVDMTKGLVGVENKTYNTKDASNSKIIH